MVVVVGDPMQGVLLAWGVAILMIISPGPALLAIMGTAMGAGRRPGVALGLGVSCGSLVWGLLAALGLSTLLVSSTDALQVVRVLGALYLLFLSYKAFRSAAMGRDLRIGTVSVCGARNYFLRGLGIHLTNPKAILAWTSMIAIGVEPGTPTWAAAAIVAGTIAFAGIFYTFAAIAFSVPAVVRLYVRGQRAADTGLGIFFLFAAWTIAT